MRFQCTHVISCILRVYCADCICIFCVMYLMFSKTLLPHYNCVYSLTGMKCNVCPEGAMLLSENGGGCFDGKQRIATPYTPWHTKHCHSRAHNTVCMSNAFLHPVSLSLSLVPVTGTQLPPTTSHHHYCDTASLTRIIPGTCDNVRCKFGAVCKESGSGGKASGAQCVCDMKCPVQRNNLASSGAHDVARRASHGTVCGSDVSTHTLTYQTSHTA